MDVQLPPVILGAILFIGLTSSINFTGPLSNMSPVFIYPGFILSALLFALGSYFNKSALECPESPFNRHISPVFFALIIIAALGYGIWEVYSTPFRMLVFFFIAGIILEIFICTFLLRLQRRTNHESYDQPSI